MLQDVPVVSSVDLTSAVPVCALTFSKPKARIFKGRTAHPFLARICGSCGAAEFYVQDPQALMAAAREAAAEESALDRS